MSVPVVISQGAGESLVELRSKLDRSREDLLPIAATALSRLVELGCNSYALLLFRDQARFGGSLWSQLVPAGEGELLGLPTRARRLAASVESLIPRIEAFAREVELNEASVLSLSALRRAGQIECLPEPVRLDDLPHFVGFVRLYGSWYDSVYRRRRAMWHMPKEKFSTLAKLASADYVKGTTGQPRIELLADFLSVSEIVHQPGAAGDTTANRDEIEAADEAERRARAPFEALKKLWQRRSHRTRNRDLIRYCVCSVAKRLVRLGRPPATSTLIH